MATSALGKSDKAAAKALQPTSAAGGNAGQPKQATSQKSDKLVAPSQPKQAPPEKNNKIAAKAVQPASAGGGTATQPKQAPLDKSDKTTAKAVQLASATGGTVSQPKQAPPEKADKTVAKAVQPASVTGGIAGQPVPASSEKSEKSDKTTAKAVQLASATGGTVSQPKQAPPEKADKTVAKAVQPTSAAGGTMGQPKQAPPENSDKTAAKAVQPASAAGGTEAPPEQTTSEKAEKNAAKAVQPVSAASGNAGLPKQATADKSNNVVTNAVQAGSGTAGPALQRQISREKNDKAVMNAAQVVSTVGGTAGQPMQTTAEKSDQVVTKTVRPANALGENVGQSSQGQKTQGISGNLTTDAVHPSNAAGGTTGRSIHQKTLTEKSDKDLATAVQSPNVAGATAGQPTPPASSDAISLEKSDKAVSDAVQSAHALGGTAEKLAHAVKIAEGENGPSKIMRAARIAGAAAVIEAEASNRATIADKAEVASQAALRAAIAEGASLEVAKAAAAASALAAGASGAELEQAVGFADRRAKETPAEEELFKDAVYQGKMEVEKQKSLGKGTSIDHLHIAGNKAAEIVIQKGGTPEQAVEAAKLAASEVDETEVFSINELSAFIRAKHGACAFSSNKVASLYEPESREGLKVEVTRALDVPVPPPTVKLRKNFCSGEIAGKPESKFQTTLADSGGEANGVEWAQSFEVSDFIDGDTIEFNVFDETGLKLLARTGLRCWECDDGLTVELPTKGLAEETKPDTAAKAKASPKPKASPTLATGASPTSPVLRVTVHSKKIAQLVGTIANLREGFENVCKELAIAREDKALAAKMPTPSSETGHRSPSKPKSKVPLASKGPQTLASSRSAAMPASKTATAQATQTREDRLREVFRVCDKQGDGSISKRDLIKLVRADASVADFFGLPQQTQEKDGSRITFESLVRSIDSSDDKHISWDEFHRFYMEEIAGSEVDKQNNEVRFELENGASVEGLATSPRVFGLKPGRGHSASSKSTPRMLSSASSPALNMTASTSGSSSQAGYQITRAALNVTVHSAIRLPNADTGRGNFSDPYCVVFVATGFHGPIDDLMSPWRVGFLEQQVCMMTKTIKDNLNPVWDDTCTFSYNPALLAPLVFKVLDEDSPSTWDDLIGVGIMNPDDFWPSGTGNKLVEIPLKMPKQFESQVGADPVLRVSIEALSDWQGEDKVFKLKNPIESSRRFADYRLPTNGLGSTKAAQKPQYGTSTFNHLTEQDQRGRSWMTQVQYQREKKRGSCAACKAGEGRSVGDKVSISLCPKCNKEYCANHFVLCGICKKGLCIVCNQKHREVHRNYSSVFLCDRCDSMTRNWGAGTKSWGKF